MFAYQDVHLIEVEFAVALQSKNSDVSNDHQKLPILQFTVCGLSKLGSSS